MSNLLVEEISRIFLNEILDNFMYRYDDDIFYYSAGFLVFEKWITNHEVSYQQAMLSCVPAVLECLFTHHAGISVDQNLFTSLKEKVCSEINSIFEKQHQEYVVLQTLSKKEKVICIVIQVTIHAENMSRHEVKILTRAAESSDGFEYNLGLMNANKLN